VGIVMRPNKIRRLAAAAAIGAFAAAWFSAPEAKAVPVGEGCVEDFWMWNGLRSATRMICDSDRAADGSWLRARGFFDDEYYVPFRCGRYSCWGGYWMPELKVIDRYRVTDGTVLGDEPGWIPSNEPRIIQ